MASALVWAWLVTGIGCSAWAVSSLSPALEVACSGATKNWDCHRRPLATAHALTAGSESRSHMTADKGLIAIRATLEWFAGLRVTVVLVVGG